MSNMMEVFSAGRVQAPPPAPVPVQSRYTAVGGGGPDFRAIQNDAEVDPKTKKPPRELTKEEEEMVKRTLRQSKNGQPGDRELNIEVQPRAFDPNDFRTYKQAR